MSDMTTYLGNKVLRWLQGNAMPAAPAAFYMALFNGDPKSGGTEITVNIRAAGRLAIPTTAVALGAANTMTSSADVDFGLSAGGGLSLTHCAVFDAQAGGNMLFTENLGGPFPVEVGTHVNFPAGDLDWTIGD